MTAVLREVGADSYEWGKWERTPVAAWGLQKLIAVKDEQYEAIRAESHWSAALIGRVTLVSLIDVIATPLLSLVMFVEGVVRLMIGLPMWGLSFIPDGPEVFDQYGSSFTWSGHQGIAGGATMFAKSVSMIPYGIWKTIQEASHLTWGSEKSV